ncbi:MAG: DUF262 domain-containing protein [Syntrophaceae bacterium]|nr:DUF262 domain-containing protein [Syntrophaceae bacterium]
MKHSQESFLELVQEAYEGNLQLPAFQRNWKWERSKVISLYDSLRKKFPIGSFLFIEADAKLSLSPKAFEGAENSIKPQDCSRLTLDGQQRITAGIALTHGLSGSSRYFLDLKAIRKLAESQKLDYRNDENVSNFLQDIDDGDDYMIATTRQGDLKTLLLENHLLSSTFLINEREVQKALEDYEIKFPEFKDFLKYLIVPNFTLDNGLGCPVISLTKEESLAAVTRIFATINTTGKRLTPIEIVNATLYAHNINLKQEVETYQNASDYVKNMDSNGEIFLQTIALLADKSPKKSLLPKTITHELFRSSFGDSLSLLDKVGEFLTLELGVGFKDTNKLIPYDSIIAPMAKVFKMKDFYKDKIKLRQIEEKIKIWFIGSALSQRYSEGAHSKQENDAKDIIKWITNDGDDFKPVWLKNTQISKDLKIASLNGAMGRLIKCLINLEKPIDPIEGIKVGYYDDVDEYPQDHHIWPKKFCIDHIKDWDESRDSTDFILNFMPLSAKTNKKWDKMDPANQLADIKSKTRNDSKRKEILDKLFLDDKCVAILERPAKERADYEDFISARFDVVVSKLSKWGFSVGEERVEDDVSNDQ